MRKQVKVQPQACELMNKSKEKISKYLETDDDGKTPGQNLWVATDTVLHGKFITTHACLMKKEEPQRNLTLYFKELRK